MGLESERLNQRICIAVTGASGSIYAERLIRFLADRVSRLYIVASDAGLQVAQYELGPKSPDDPELSLVGLLNGHVPDRFRDVIRLQKSNDLFSPIASGSSVPDRMIIVPASMGTVARVAHGLSGNLIERAADVVIKERKSLIIVPRETPLSTIHLQNLLSLSQQGAHIIPAMPGFYNRPQSLDEQIDFVVGKVVDALGLDHDLFKRWNARMR